MRGFDIAILANDRTVALVKRSAEINGEKKQLDQLKEECAELIVALSHFERGRKSAEAIHEEMVDVMLMIAATCRHVGTVPPEMVERKTLKLQKWILAQGEEVKP